MLDLAVDHVRLCQSPTAVAGRRSRLELPAPTDVVLRRRADRAARGKGYTANVVRRAHLFLAYCDVPVAANAHEETAGVKSNNYVLTLVRYAEKYPMRQKIFGGESLDLLNMCGDIAAKQGGDDARGFQFLWGVKIAITEGYSRGKRHERSLAIREDTPGSLALIPCLKRLIRDTRDETFPKTQTIFFRISIGGQRKVLRPLGQRVHGERKHAVLGVASVYRIGDGSVRVQVFGVDTNIVTKKHSSCANVLHEWLHKILPDLGLTGHDRLLTFQNFCDFQLDNTSPKTLRGSCVQRMIVAAFVFQKNKLRTIQAITTWRGSNFAPADIVAWNNITAHIVLAALPGNRLLQMPGQLVAARALCEHINSILAVENATIDESRMVCDRMVMLAAIVNNVLLVPGITNRNEINLVVEAVPHAYARRLFRWIHTNIERDPLTEVFVFPTLEALRQLGKTIYNKLDEAARRAVPTAW